MSFTSRSWWFVENNFYTITTNFSLTHHRRSNIAISANNTGVRVSRMYNRDRDKCACKYNFIACSLFLPKCKLEQTVTDGSIMQEGNKQPTSLFSFCTFISRLTKAAVVIITQKPIIHYYIPIIKHASKLYQRHCFTN